VLQDQTVTCWGSGIGAAATAAGVTGAVAVTVGFSHRCALQSGGTVVCWGDNSFGQLGSPDAGSGPIVVASNAVSVAAGYYHTCAALQDGTVSCWGQNGHGELGSPDAGATSSTPLVVTGISDALGVAAGVEFTCAYRQGVHASCWGLNNVGQLGAGTDAGGQSPIPLPVVGY
jgi:hypothetical protein